MWISALYDIRKEGRAINPNPVLRGPAVAGWWRLLDWKEDVFVL
jgi:hypothetical protein